MAFLPQYPQLESILKLARQKKTPIYLVGGFWRDHVLGRSGVDFDFAVSRGAIALARSAARSLKGAFVLLDEDNGCARVVKKEGGRSLIFDFADFRAPTIDGDLRHRDFTINAVCGKLADVLIAEDVGTVLMDPLNGLKDVQKGVIRMTGPGVFAEDPLRLLRAFSLQASLGFRIEPRTLSRIKKDKELLLNVSAERVREELFKVLASDRAGAGLKAMDRIGLLEKVIPQISVMAGCRQGGYHHLDVWPHSLETVAQFEGVLKEFAGDPDVRAYLNEPVSGEHKRYSVIKLAALLHDIGKPQTQKREPGGRMSFHGHEHVGKSIVRAVANMLKLSTHERYMIEDMVRWHLRPGYLSDFKEPSDRAIFRYFRDTKEEAVSVLLLSLADQRSTRGPMTSEADQRQHERIVRKLLGRYFAEKKIKPVKRFINGHDLIKKLKLKPSPVFAEILRSVEEQQALGEIATKEEALTLARRIALKSAPAKTNRSRK